MLVFTTTMASNGSSVATTVSTTDDQVDQCRWASNLNGSDSVAQARNKGVRTWTKIISTCTGGDVSSTQLSPLPLQSWDYKTT